MRKLRNEELNRLTGQEFRGAPKSDVIVILDNIRSMNNIGSVFRTSDAFRVNAIFLCGITARPPHREIQRTALGATESVQWEYFDKTENAVLSAKDKGYKVVVVEQTTNSKSLEEFIFNPDESYAFVFGNELSGVDEQVLPLADSAVEIPQFGTKHSFNIAVSAGIVLWQWFISVGADKLK
ncbi:MAG: RNA methyltransferase [Bacteroidales bacterium]